MAESDFHAYLGCTTCEIAMSTNESSKSMILCRLMSIDSSIPELEFEESCCNLETESDYGTELEISDDEHEELPPPRIFSKSNGHSQTLQECLTRSSSCQSSASRGKELLNSKHMTRSMPNLQSNRSHYNRKVGSTLSCNTSMHGAQRAVLNRIVEFDVLLESI